MSDRLFKFSFHEEQPQRLDKFLVAKMPEFSRSRIQGLIKDGLVEVDGKRASKAGQMLEGRGLIQVRVPPPEPSDLVPEAIPLQVIFDNRDLLVVNKPAGMVVHPAAGHTTGTLVHAVLAYAPDIEGVGGKQRPGVVHRLDKETSGLILIAKNEPTHRWLQEQFRAHKVQKTYLALVDGHPPTPTGRIEAAIGRDSKQRQKMAVVSPSKGRQALSEYRSIEKFANHTLLEVHPITGRTHQIRLHLAYLGCPVTGDTVYGKRHPTIALNRYFLHAASLKLHLRGEAEPHIFKAPLPDELVRVLNELRQKEG